MAGIKDKVVTTESLSVLHEYNKKEFSNIQTQFANVQTQFNGVQTQFNGVQTQLSNIQTNIETQFDDVQTQFDGKADSSHSHTAVEVGAVPNIEISNTLNAVGWYNVGTLSTSHQAGCAAMTLTIGGVYNNTQASNAIIDISMQYGDVVAYTRVPSITASQISRVGLLQYDAENFYVLVYYTTSTQNHVYINAQTYMGVFTPANLQSYTVDESNMSSIIPINKYSIPPLSTDCYGDTLPAAGTVGRIFFKKL